MYEVWQALPGWPIGGKVTRLLCTQSPSEAKRVRSEGNYRFISEVAFSVENPIDPFDDKSANLHPDI